MKTAIYKGRRKYDTYLFVENEDVFGRVPDTLLNMLGELEHVMTIELSHDRKLAAADTAQVMDSLREQGYFLQLPPETGGIQQNSLTEYRRPGPNQAETC